MKPPRLMASRFTVYVYHYGNHVKLKFGANGPHVGMKEQDLPDKIKYAIAARGSRPSDYDIAVPIRGEPYTVAVEYPAKEFIDLAASVNLLLVPR